MPFIHVVEIFQFLMVRLKACSIYRISLSYKISIPYGSIKSTSLGYLRKSVHISIPYGSIKSPQCLWQYNSLYLISIPYGSIKRDVLRAYNAGLLAFQFLMVRLKALVGQYAL